MPQILTTPLKYTDLPITLTSGGSGTKPLLNLGNVSSYLGYNFGGGEVFFNIATPDTVFTIDILNVGSFRVGTAGIFIVGGRNTAASGTGTLGVPPIFAQGAQTLNTNVAPTTLSYTPPATAGVYRLSAYLDVLTAGTMTFKAKITYKDPGGNARTDVPAFYLQNTTALLAGGPAANTTGQYVMFPYTFAIDNSATAITIQDNAGTYTAGTYYWTPILEGLA